MPSSRRIRTIAVTAVLVLITLLYFSSSTSASDKNFYDRTVAALNIKHEASSQKMGTAAVMDTKLREAAKVVKEEVAADAQERRKNDKETSKGAKIEIDDTIKDGQQQVLGGIDDKDAPDVKEPESKQKLPHEVGSTQSKWGGSDADVEKEAKPEKTEEEERVDAVLTLILKRSPIIIFSKSYCPFSKKAKAIFAKYAITPVPFIVELDLHELGPQLQDKLLDTTGRRTVPNVLINGKSIGGGDDVEALDKDNKLVDKIKTMGGKRIMVSKIEK